MTKIQTKNVPRSIASGCGISFGFCAPSCDGQIASDGTTIEASTGFFQLGG